jgi:hypothetical protein
MGLDGGLLFALTICFDSDPDLVVVQEDAVSCVKVVERFEMVGKERGRRGGGGGGGGQRLLSEILEAVGWMGQVDLRHSLGVLATVDLHVLASRFPRADLG